VPRAPSLSGDPSPSRITRKSDRPRVPNRTMVANLTTFCFVGFGTDRLRHEEAMKTAGRENPNHGVACPHSRAHGAAGQNKSRSIKWAAKQEKFQPLQKCFFLTSTFIELHRTHDWLGGGFVVRSQTITSVCVSIRREPATNQEPQIACAWRRPCPCTNSARRWHPPEDSRR
jgi:hypothetical protein